MASLKKWRKNVSTLKALRQTVIEVSGNYSIRVRVKLTAVGLLIQCTEVPLTETESFYTPSNGIYAF